MPSPRPEAPRGFGMVSLADTAPPKELNPHWIRYSGCMVRRFGMVSLGDAGQAEISPHLPTPPHLPTSPHISPHLPTSTHISPHLPTSPHISPPRLGQAGAKPDAQQQMVKNVMRGAAVVIVPATAWFESGVFIYWLTAAGPVNSVSSHLQL